jgi:hypothetical protein
VALSTGCFRAHSWRSKTAERLLPCFQVPATSLPTLPSILANRLSLPYDQEFRPPPWRVDCLLRDRLPTRVEGPSGVNSPVRLRRRTLTRPVLPLRAFPPASESRNSPCDISLRGPRHCWLSSRYETPRSVVPTDPPADLLAETGSPPDRRSSRVAYREPRSSSPCGSPFRCSSPPCGCVPALQNRSMNQL